MTITAELSPATRFKRIVDEITGAINHSGKSKRLNVAAAQFANAAGQLVEAAMKASLTVEVTGSSSPRRVTSSPRAMTMTRTRLLECCLRAARMRRVLFHRGG